MDIVNNIMATNNLQIYARLFLYFFITVMITLGLNLESLDLEHMDKISFGVWLKTGIKSIIPALISIKAYLDNSFTGLNVPKISLNSTKAKKESKNG